MLKIQDFSCFECLCNNITVKAADVNKSCLNIHQTKACLVVSLNIQVSFQNAVPLKNYLEFCLDFDHEMTS